MAVIYKEGRKTVATLIKGKRVPYVAPKSAPIKKIDVEKVSVPQK